MNNKLNKIGIIDCNIGNIYSVENALKKLKCNYEISKDPKIIDKSEKIILLGVGSFPAVMKNLNLYGFTNLLNKCYKQGRYLLGICVGMQVFMTSGEEDATTKGLNFIKGNVELLKFSKGHPIPHMGWNEVFYKNKSNINIFTQIKNKSSFYFIHSYHIKIKEKKIQTLLTRYGNNTIVAAIKKENIYGVQFHPEKSQSAGIQILENFINL